MAIVLEEEKKSIDWGFIIGILLIVGIIATAVVYLFFVSPETTEGLISNPQQRQLEEFGNVTFRPEDVINSKQFQDLKATAPLNAPSQGEVGKSNPFLQ